MNLDNLPAPETVSLDLVLQLVKETIHERLEQHKWNLELWQNGCWLNPTEPDPEEREIIKSELKAAILELEYLKKACNL